MVTRLKNQSPVVVGIGASAGGLEALKDFFSALPADTGMAFIVVQHLEPSHESRMAEILTKTTAMKVVQAEDGMAVEPNAVYTNAPGREMEISQGRLILNMAAKRQHVTAVIDHFLNSLADDQREQSIAIIFSGSSGSDGLQGIRAIRGAGGMCMAQEPRTAQFPEMPQSAIDTGLVDYVLAPTEMPAALLKYAQHPKTTWTRDDETPVGAVSKTRESILDLLQSRTGRDYHLYKRTMIMRRIERRMALHQMSRAEEYLHLLEGDPNELTQLAKDLLIGVSSFFRDAKGFEELRRVIDATLAEARSGDEPLRAWVAGCATGEEAYSVAMLLMEAAEAAGRHGPVQVFASDVDERALEIARAGIYPETIADDIAWDRLQKFFVRHETAYHVTKPLRETVVFSRHNLLSDPPFSKLDLISCRNVFIYLEAAAQKKVLSMFSFALKLGGCLFLGRAEGIAGLENFFEPVNKENRIYRLTRANRQGAAGFPLAQVSAPPAEIERHRSNQLASALTQARDDALLRHFNASLVLIDPVGTILYFHGRTERYLGHPKGPASLNILDMTEGTLSVRLRRAIDQALQQAEPVMLHAVPLPAATGELANLTVRRASDDAQADKILAVIFEDAKQPLPPDVVASALTESEPLVKQLEAEVKVLRQELRTNAEAYDAANADLRTASEEVMSMNEELQSANEELEASKEELSSINEELNSVNSQLNETISGLTVTNNDLSNLIAATEIATVFLDDRLRLKRFTPSATDLLNIIASDIGRPVSHITQNFTGVDMAADAQNVLKTLTAVEREVSTPDGRWFTLRVLPYRTQDNRIDGAVITFSDVTRLKRIEANIQFEKKFAEDIVETVRHPLVVFDEQLRILSANKAFYQLFRIDTARIGSQRIDNVLLQQGDVPALRQVIEQLSRESAEFENVRIEYDITEIGRRILSMTCRRIAAAGDLPSRILLSLEDITDIDQAHQAEREAAHQALEHRAQQLRELAIQILHTEKRERERLARVLHDDLQQLMIGAKFPLQTARSQTKNAQVLQSIAGVEEILGQMIETSRTLVSDLCPSILYKSGLDAALPWLAKWMNRVHGIEVATETHAKLPHGEDGLALLLYDAARELLLNVVKHAQVNQAHVLLDKPDDGHIRLEVSDKGVGFDPTKGSAREPGASSGLGLFGLRERLAHVGGTCEIQSAPGHGTRVILTIPLSGEANK